ncbi:MAG TPA: bacillithiol biosynthesis BshC, partial [Gemmatimonadaceae bacterium]|nr:bacillithiol biosynthesis BshC [Gemmatimonadaceae bacterium]
LPRDLRAHAPRDVTEWQRHVTNARRSNWLSPLAPAMAASGAAAARLGRAGVDGVVVTTGQQAGVFGGPLYTLSKALTAIALANAIEREFDVPAAPVFWAATDDADFLEASLVHLADVDGLHEVRLTNAPPPGTIMAHAPLGDTRRALAQLRAACGSAAHAEYLEIVHSAFSGARSIGDAYVMLMREILEPLGMAVLDSSHAAYRQTARPLLLDALGRSWDIASALSETAARIRANGFEPQVQDERGLSLVFEITNGVKRRISVAEAADAAQGDTDLAPNVLLRPVAERAILPTVAYVAGPGELAYFAQSNAVADALEQPRVVGVPRWSATIIEPFVERALARLQVPWTDLRDVHALERRLALASIPPGVAAAWKELREETDAGVRKVVSAVRSEALLPDEVLEGLRRGLQHRLARGERRLLAAAKRRNTEVRKDLTAAGAALFPLGKRQERVLNFIPMLARGGSALRDDMLMATDDHVRGLLGVDRAASVATR